MIIMLTAIVCAACVLLADVWHLFSLAAIAMALLLAFQGLLYFRQSRTDALTGLANLRKLKDRKPFYRKREALTVVYLDLDHLKQTNDTQGHAAGDRLLKDTAKHLRAFRKDAHIYRLSGDEFLLIFRAAAPSDFHERWDRAGIKAAYGTVSGTGKELDDLTRRAEQEMYSKKANQ